MNNKWMIVPLLLPIALAGCAGDGSSAHDDSPRVAEHDDDVVMDTIVTPRAEGGYDVRQVPITLGERRAQEAERDALVRRTAAAGVGSAAQPLITQDGSCAGSSFWAYSEQYRSGNRLCLAGYDDSGNPKYLSDFCYTYFNGTCIATWSTRVRSFYAGQYHGRLGNGTGDEAYAAYQIKETLINDHSTWITALSQLGSGLFMSRGRAPLVLLLVAGVAAVNACAAAGTDAADEAPGAGAGGSATGGGSGSGSGATSGGSGKSGSGAMGGGSAGDGGTGGSSGSSGGGGDAGSGQGGGASGSAGAGSAGKAGGPGACGNACGPVELCDPDHLGFDDNCDGQVDEGCPCTDGQSHWCFKGDPSYRGSSGCFDGTERCSGGVWGACQGGKHGLPGEDSCLGAAGACIDLQASPFAKVKLGDGTKGFAGDADPGSHKYQVTCPSGVQSCPQVKDPTSAAASFQPLQSGQYNVVYSKTVGGVPQSCNYAVYVAGEGLRVELSWDNVGVEGVSPNAAKGPDLDLHVHRPSTTTNWLFTGTGDDCFFGNCRIDNFAATGGPGDPVGGPSWFADAPAPSPHNWTKHAEDAKNSCYFAPRGVGNQWKALGKGCHNPRLDLDNFGCEAGIADPDDPSFCAPENVNFDELPDKTWVRIAAHYFGSCTKTLPTHPLVTVYCNGGQVAQLGSKGGMPLGYSEPVTMQPADCQKKMWLAADVYVKQGTCSIECTVVPLHEGATKKPLVVAVDGASAPFGPGYPAAP